MEIEAIFSGIQKKIIIELEKARRYIYIAVAWFTDPELLAVLESALDRGVNVKVILADDEINKGTFGLNFKNYLDKGGTLIFGGKTDNSQRLMHNKFCVIDGIALITGSYNWSKKARNNYENVTIIKDNFQVIQEFIFEFQNILYRYGNKKEIDDTLIGTQIFDLDKYRDPNTLRLRNRILILEYQIVYLEQRKIEILKNIKAFEDKHDKELGQIILDILYFRKIRIEKDNLKGLASEEELNEANEKFEKYKNVFENNIRRIEDSNNKGLNDDELKSLKKYYREATFICHPDKVSADFKNVAKRVFNELNQAYKNNDIDRVKAILKGLKSGIWDIGKKTENFIEIDYLNSKSEILELKIKKLEEEINELKESETYKKIEAIDDWNFYFEEQKKKLLAHLELLKR